MPRLLKVLQLIPTLDRSGAEKQMVLLAKGLPKDRFDVEVAALTRLGPFETELRQAGVPITLIGKRFKIDPFCLSKLKRFLIEKRFDVIQTWIFAANTYGRIAAHRARTPIVVTSEMAVDLWKGKGHLAIDRYLARWTDRVVGNSRAVVDFYRAAGIPEKQLEVIRSGIALEELPIVDRNALRSEFGVDPTTPLILFVGRLAPQKGVADLLFALDLLQHVIPNINAWIVGAGPLKGELEGLARGHRLEDKVRFLGHREDVAQLLIAADILVLPSYYEGLPNVVLEAMWARRPVVATSAPGTTEVLEDGVSGLLVPPGKPAQLTRAMRSLILDHDLAERIAQAGKDRVETEFHASAMIEKFAKLYETLATDKRLY